MSDSIPTPIFVSGGSGRMAGKVIAELLDTYEVPASEIITCTRTPEKLSQFADRGVSVRYGDFNDPASLDEACAGAKRALIIPTVSFEVPRQRITEHLNAVEACKSAGVEHVVFVTFHLFDRESPVSLAEDYWRADEAIRESDMTWTFIHDAWYMNVWEIYLPTILARGEWLTCNGGRPSNQVERDDCSRSIAAVLGTPGHDNTRYTITGPEALTVEQMASTASEIFERPIEVREVSEAEYERDLLTFGETPAMVASHASFEVNIRMGREDIVTDHVKRLTGREPMSFRDFLIENRERFPAEVGYGHPMFAMSST